MSTNKWTNGHVRSDGWHRLCIIWYVCALCELCLTLFHLQAHTDTMTKSGSMAKNRYSV